ncbi:biosynthetic-type acetolactate synthase large subunit [Enterococcus bulliens]
MTKRTGAHQLLDALAAQEVEFIFGYPGGAVLPIYDALYDYQKIKHILVRHEQGATHAAQGYTKVSGKPGVVLVTSGPGATNAVTGIADAMSDSLPMIVLTGQVATSGIGKDSFQEADMLGITMPITKYNYQIRAAEEIEKVVNEAFHLATTGRMGPVLIDIPKDLMAQLIELEAPQKTPVSLPNYQPNRLPNPQQIKKVLEALSQAKRPLVLVGAGVSHAHATKELRAFIQHYQLPTLTTLLGLGVVANDDPLFLGMGGMHGSYAANMALTECDLLLNFGSRFDDRLASSPSDFAPHAKIVHVDLDPAEIGKVVRVDIPLVADVKETLLALNQADQLPQMDRKDWSETLAEYKLHYPFTYESSSDQIKPQAVIETIGRLTNGEALVATDVGQHQMWVAQFYPFTSDHQLITSGGLGTMGYGIPAAIGAQIAQPDRKVVIFVGDGGFQMTNQELILLKQYQLPIKVILLNNHTLGMVHQWQHTFFSDHYSESEFEQQPNFVALAKAYGLDAFTLSDPQTVEAQLAKAFDDPNAQVIEIIIPASEEVLPMVPAGKANNQMIGVVRV